MEYEVVIRPVAVIRRFEKVVDPFAVVPGAATREGVPYYRCREKYEAILFDNAAAFVGSASWVVHMLDGVAVHEKVKRIVRIRHAFDVLV